jgi:hypothetical protein
MAQQQQQYRRPFGGEETQESFDETPEGEAPLDETAMAQPEPGPSQPELPPSEGDVRQPRRFEDRPRQQFDRSRNGADQPRQPRIEDQAEGWDGPQPQFLRRGQQPSGGQPNNGAERQQQPHRRMGRGPRPRDEQAPAEEAEGSPAPSSEPDTPVVN